MKKPRTIFGFLSLIPGLAMSFMDQTILPVALPTIQNQFHAGSIALQWAVNSYLLTTAILVLAAGKLSDRIGHRRAMISGITLFAFSSALCGLSPNIGFLIGARALQGFGAALIFPAQGAIIASLYPPEKRGKATGMMASVGSLFLILGPLLGGYLTESVSWRAIFWINLPIAIIGCLMARFFIPPSKPDGSKIDSRGFSYFAILSSALTVLFMQGNDWGWTSPMILALYPAIAISLFLLFRREKKAAHPFLDLTLFKHPVFSAVNISIAITQFILMVTVFRSIYFQIVLGYTPAQTGILTFISSFPILFLSPLGGYLADKMGPKVPVSFGFLFLFFSFVWFGIFSTPSLTSILIASIPFGMGIPLIFTPSYSAALSSVPPQKIGVGSGMIATFRTLAATAGVALIGLLTDTIQNARFLAAPELQSLPRSQLLDISSGRLPIADLPSALQPDLARALLEARTLSFSVVHYVLALLLLLMFAIVFTLHHRKSAHCLPSSPAEGWD